jgi:hypothetical protein
MVFVYDEPSHHRPVAWRNTAVRSAQQAQSEHEVNHRLRWEQPLPFLAAARQNDHLINEIR